MVVWLFGGLGKFVVVAGNIPKRLNDLTTKPLVSAAKVWGNGVRNTEKSLKDDVFGRILTFINRNKGVSNYSAMSIYQLSVLRTKCGQIPKDTSKG